MILYEVCCFYIFFKISDKESPIGSQVVPLTPERSIAIDPAYINYGLPIWVVTQINNSEKFTKLLNVTFAYH